MRPVLPADLLDRVVARYPLPVADAVAALAAAEGPHEARDRVVEVFRATLRWLALLALAARAQYGTPGRGEGPEVAELLAALGRRRLTDGQWTALVRGLAQASAPGEGPLPGLGRLAGQADFWRAVDGLLTMRRAETVAHGATGDEGELEARLGRRAPQLIALLEGSEQVWGPLRLVVPRTASGGWSLMGCTPPRGRWRAVELPPPHGLPPGEPVLVDEAGGAVLALAPLAQVRRAAASLPEELFALDGPARRGVLYVALPSMTEHVEGADRWPAVARALALADEEEPVRPYRGLDSFGPEHAELFFGREAQGESLAARLRQEALVVVTGPSGAGKTSLVRAGVLPRLTEHLVVELRPGADPCGALARCLGQLVGEEAEAVASVLRRSPEAVGQALARWAAQARRPLLLVVDQAEELFTLGADARQRLLFARALVAGLAPGGAHLALVVREDHLARLASLDPLRPLVGRAIELVSTPDEAALGRALALPAARLGYRFDDPGLVARMVADAAGEPAALALLQFCADRLWEARDRRWRRLTADAYAALGGVEGALAAHAERTLLALPPAQQASARALLLRLVSPDGRRSLVSRDDLLAAAPHRDASAVLERLVEARLVVAREQGQGGDAFELAHEALLGHWPRLRAWREQGRGDQLHLDALRQAARAWADRDRPRALLWRGEVLADHLIWSHHTEAPLAPLEAEFLAASEADRRRASRGRAAAALGALGALSLATAVLAVQRADAVRSREAAERQRARAEQARAQADAALAQSERGRLAAEAGRRESLGQRAEAAALLRAARALAAEEAAAPARAAGPAASGVDPLDDALARLVSLDDTPSGLSAGPGAVRALLASPDGRWLLAAGSPDRAFALPSLAEVDLTAAGSPAADPPLAALADQARLPPAPPPPPAVDPSERAGPPARVLAWSPDASRLVTASSSRGVRLHDAGLEPRPLEGHERPVLSAALSPDGRLVATGAADGLIWLHDARSGRPLRSLRGPASGVGALVFSGDGRWLAAGSRGDDGSLRVWEVTAPAAPLTLRGHSDDLLALAWSPDGDLVATASRDHTARLWSTGDGGQRHRLDHRGPVFALAFSPDGRRLVTAARERSPRLWSVLSGTSLQTLPDHGGYSPALLFAPDGRLLTASVDRRVRLFDPSGAPAAALGPLAGVPFRLALSPDARRLAALADDDRVHFLDPAAPAAPDAPDAPTAPGYAEAAAAQGDRLAAGTTAGTATVWSASLAAPLATVRGHAGAVLAAALSPDGRWLATGSSDHTAALWRLPSGEPGPALPDHGAPVLAAAFSPDGQRLATATADGVVRVWSTYTGERLAALAGHAGPVVALAFSPDGQRLASASRDATARLWSARSWQPGQAPADALGARTNLRVCRDGGALVAVTPRPPPASVWAPPDACPR